MSNNSSDVTNTIVSMIFTHQARMRCFVKRIMKSPLNSSLDGLFNNRTSTTESVGTDDFTSARGSLRGDSFASVESDYGDIDVDPDTGERLAMYRNDQQMSYGGAPTAEDMLLPLTNQTKQAKINRFKNGSVLEITITQSSIAMRLLLEGEIDEPKPKYVYYVIPGSENKDAGALNGQYQVTPFVPVKIQNTIYQDVGNKKYVFYLMRHGQATHNLVGTKFQKFSKIFSGERDTHLTDAGREQAVRTGIKMRGLLSSTTDSIAPPTFLFTSDLKRTRETLAEFMKGMAIPYDTSVYILPCSHELNYTDDGNCDGNQQATPPENKMTCTASTAECMSVNNLPVNWDKYYRFYGNSTRSNMCKACGAKQCRNTDMIQEAMNIIKEKLNKDRKVTFSDASGGSHRTRKRAKATNQKKHTTNKKAKQSKKSSRGNKRTGHKKATVKAKRPLARGGRLHVGKRTRRARQ